ncbi:MAG: plastocyanin/azurin family copper-binding protein [Edaphobacter sp.]
MKFANSTLVVVALSLVSLSLTFPRTAEAQQNWKAGLGAQSKDLSKQAIAFLPNELWIHAGDSITWTSAAGDIHTVSFFIAGQPYNDFNTGCPGFTPNPSIFDGSKCVSAPPLVAGQSFTVKFPKAGNYKLLCLVHPHMTGVIHVLAANAALPHDQYFYNEQAEKQTRALLSDADNDREHHSHEQMEDMLSARVWHGNGVAAGIGEINATAAGFQSLSVVRFLHGTIEIHAGETVEWSVLDPAEPHTITFGVEPANPGPPSANVSFDADGGRHATLNAPGDSTHSGIIGAVPMDQAGVPQSPPSIPVFRVTFVKPGTYNYKCALHDNLGMVGKVVVLP